MLIVPLGYGRYKSLKTGDIERGAGMPQAQWSKETRTPVSAHQVLGEGPWCRREPRGGDRRAYGQQEPRPCR